MAFGVTLEDTPRGVFDMAVSEWSGLSRSPTLSDRLTLWLRIALSNPSESYGYAYGPSARDARLIKACQNADRGKHMQTFLLITTTNYRSNIGMSHLNIEL